MSKGTRITKRWIDADGIMRACYNSYLTTGNKAYSEIIELVEAVPAADVVEVKHGKWEWNNEDEFFYSCSNCGHKAYGNTNEIVSGLYAYCPNCGAKMDGDTE